MIQVGDEVKAECWDDTEIVRSFITVDGVKFALFDHGGFWHVDGLRKAERSRDEAGE